MELVHLADAAAAAYVTGLSTHAAAATDAAARSWFERLRTFLTSRSSIALALGSDEENLSAAILRALRENPEDAQELEQLLSRPGSKIEGAGTVYGDVTLRGKYVAGRDIRFDRQ
ncbi:hypothetical protein [Streptomyces sp. CRN 30]|uniref:hypothetical protein n=1 Tax=Streptomyces sp. CRN 30 TaxID=3075613 RepID=UPI002A82B3DD|nr:hypothetical protein [Streptomyces sp. CRN 30]